MDIELFNYELPKELIAQQPHIPRDECRLMVVNRKEDTIQHRIFKDIVEYLTDKDLLILNDTKVIPARIFAKKPTGGRIEIFLLEKLGRKRYSCLTKGKIKDKQTVILKDSTEALIEKTDSQERIVTFLSDAEIEKRLSAIGEVPLPPYIKRDYDNYNKSKDYSYYQTVYAKKEGAVAAPTAGLHFTQQLLEKIKEKGVKIAYITLHVGIGTFQPVKEKRIEDHKMHEEFYTISKEAAQLYNETKERQGRVIAVGTTVVRALESAADEGGRIAPKSEKTSIFIYPGYKYRAVDALITNFHLPKSTLLMLVSAFYDREKILECYREAVEKLYRFFSFGDAMFIY